MLRSVLLSSTALLACGPGIGMLGKVTPATANWMNCDGAPWNGGVQFTDDTRNVCPSDDQGGPFGHVAILSVSSVGFLDDGNVIPWIAMYSPAPTGPSAVFGETLSVETTSRPRAAR